MTCRTFNFSRQSAASRTAMSLVELMVAVGISAILLSGIMMLFISSQRSFVAMGNYVELNRYSRGATDQMTREIRQASALVSFSPTAPKSLTFTIFPTNDPNSYTVSYQWVSNSTESYISRSVGSNPPTVLLTNVEMWNFSLYQRTPFPNNANQFYQATNISGVLDPKYCKLIDMTWKCSREILGRKINTEVVQTTQIVLRNKGSTQ